MAKKKAKPTNYYVGLMKDTRTFSVFRSAKTPSEGSHGGKYAYAIGPFRTKRGAVCMAKHGQANPHLVSVEQAERAARTWCK